jgi:hypothetical protein|tara:strand:+ start:9033 stop:9527 length:495 start_codon:yes stop_codon:yes gene_type:complete
MWWTEQMAETDQRSTVVNALKKLHAVAVENPAGPGTPDVNFVEGWMELKWEREWPARESTALAVRHYTPQQRDFAVDRSMRGGLVLLMLQVRREWLLFDGLTACEVVGIETRAGLRQAALRLWDNGLEKEDLLKWLTSYQTQKPYASGGKERALASLKRQRGLR